MTEKFLDRLNICEKWQAGKEVVIPAGAVAYHLVSRRKYSADEKLKFADRYGDLLVCRTSFNIQLREVPVMLRRGEAGPSVHVAWCSLDLKVVNVVDLSTELGTELSLSYDELAEKLTQSLKDTLPGFEGFDLTAKQIQNAVEIKAPKEIDLLKGLSVDRFVLRRVLTEREYIEETVIWAEFERKLTRLTNDKRIGQALAKLENDKVQALLTSDERKMSPEQRFERYLELFGLANKSIEIQKRILDETKKGVEINGLMLDELRGIKRVLSGSHKALDLTGHEPPAIPKVRQEDEPQDEKKEKVYEIKPVSLTKHIYRTDFVSGNTQITKISGSSQIIEKQGCRGSRALQIDGSKGECRIVLMADSKKFKNKMYYGFLVKLKTKKGGKVYFNAYCPLRRVGHRESDPTVFFVSKEVNGANKWQPIEGKIKTLSVSKCRRPCDCSRQGCISERGCTVELGVVTSDQNFLIDSIDIKRCPEEA